MLFNKTRASEAKQLQKQCIAYQEKKNNPELWAHQCRELIKGYEINFESMTKREVAKIIRERNQSRLTEKAKDMMSLELFCQLYSPSKLPGYLKIPKNKRAGLAKFRLGGYIWESEKREDGSRICGLCGGSENFIHILVDCSGLTELRDTLVPEVQYDNIVQFLTSDDEEKDKRLCLFIDAFFQKRKEQDFF